MQENELYKILDEMQSEDFPEVFAIIAEAIGKEAALKLVLVFERNIIYIPTARFVLRKGIAKRILEEFNGYNVSKLASKYGVGTRTVNNIVNGKEVTP